MSLCKRNWIISLSMDYSKRCLSSNRFLPHKFASSLHSIFLCLSSSSFQLDFWFYFFLSFFFRPISMSTRHILETNSEHREKKLIRNAERKTIGYVAFLSPALDFFSFFLWRAVGTSLNNNIEFDKHIFYEFFIQISYIYMYICMVFFLYPTVKLAEIIFISSSWFGYERRQRLCAAPRLVCSTCFIVI